MDRSAAGGLSRWRPPRSPAAIALTGNAPSELPGPAAAVVGDLLARLDRALPGRIEGFYAVGSAAMRGFVAGRSDVDFVAIVDRDLGRAELARLRALHVGRWASALVRDVGLRRRWPLVCNGIYLRSGDLARSPLEVLPLAGHVSGRFRVASRNGFDVNPVTWHTLARHGIAVRGPEPGRLTIRTDPAELRAWTVSNLNDYWRRWVDRARHTGANRATMLGRRFTAAGVLGAPRLHYTIATGRSRPRRPPAGTRWRRSSRAGARRSRMRCAIGAALPRPAGTAATTFGAGMTRRSSWAT